MTKFQIPATEHILIEGDNLEVMELLMRKYAGKIKCIYIDPPFNSKSNRVNYTDDFIGLGEETWGAFIEKRLKLAHKLLTDDGFMFVSIGSEEVISMGVMLEMIFGYGEMVALCVNNTGGNYDKHGVKNNIEYLYIYKGGRWSELNPKIKNFKEEGSQGLAYRGKEDKISENSSYSIYYHPYLDVISLEPCVGFIEIKPTHKGQPTRWTWSKEKAEKDIHLLFVRKNRKGEFEVRRKIEQGKAFESARDVFFSYSTAGGTKELERLVPGTNFPYAKNPDYIKEILSMCMNDGDICLDFFAGSGTTGQALLNLNLEDNGRRQFILITNNENNICQKITLPRVRACIKEFNQKSKIPANLQFYQMEDGCLVRSEEKTKKKVA